MTLLLPVVVGQHGESRVLAVWTQCNGYVIVVFKAREL